MYVYNADKFGKNDRCYYIFPSYHAIFIALDKNTHKCLK